VDGVDDLYASSYARLVSVVGAVTGSRVEAEEAVQDAFVRLIGQWERVRHYDDPEGWLRGVALGYASNARRKRRNGWRALRRQVPVAHVPSPDGSAVDLRRALDALPFGQRAVLVLVHVVGLDLESVARELSIPVGTVKSRLSRGRAALAPLLSEELTDRA
jgi:DNA-directed RNA polymerase specialized sigma24 family protein